MLKFDINIIDLERKGTMEGEMLLSSKASSKVRENGERGMWQESCAKHASIVWGKAAKEAVLVSGSQMELRFRRFSRTRLSLTPLSRILLVRILFVEDT